MSGETSPKSKVSSDEVASSFSSQDSWRTNSNDTILGDDPFEMRSDTSDPDAAKDMNVHASAARIKAPEGEKPSRRRPWARARAENSSDHGDAEAMQRIMPEEGHAKLAHDVDGSDNVSQSNRECQSREFVRRQSVLRPTRLPILELSEKVTVTEIRSTLPSLRSATLKPSNACPDSDSSFSRSVSLGCSPKIKSTQYSMLQFNATPTLSTACDSVKTKRPCSARERVTRSGETRRPALNSRSLTEPEATPQDAKDSFGQEACLAACRHVTESKIASRPRSNSRSSTKPEATVQDNKDSFGQEASFAACRRVMETVKARRPAHHSRSLTEPEATPQDTKDSFGQEASFAACRRVMESVKARRPVRNSRSLTEPEATPQDTKDSVEQEASLSACKRFTKSGKARRPAFNSRSLTEPEETSSDSMDSSGHEATLAEALDSFRKMSSSEAHVVLNTYMREALSTRAPPIHCRHRRHCS